MLVDFDFAVVLLMTCLLFARRHLWHEHDGESIYDCLSLVFWQLVPEIVQPNCLRLTTGLRCRLGSSARGGTSRLGMTNLLCHSNPLGRKEVADEPSLLALAATGH